MSDTNTRYVDRPGVYRCRIKTPGNGWFGEAGENQTPFIRIPCLVLDEGDQEGREIVWQGWLTDAAFDRTIGTLVKVCPEWNGDLAALADGDFTFADNECEIVAENDTYEGKTRVKAQWLNPLGGGGGKTMDKARLDGLLGALGRKAKAIAKQAKAGSAPQGRPAPKSTAPAEDDDIPY